MTYLKDLIDRLGKALRIKYRPPRPGAGGALHRRTPSRARAGPRAQDPRMNLTDVLILRESDLLAKGHAADEHE